MITEIVACLVLHCDRCNKPSGDEDEGRVTHWKSHAEIAEAFPEGKEGPDGWRRIGDRHLCGDCCEETPDGAWVEKEPLRAIDEAIAVRARLDYQPPTVVVTVPGKWLLAALVAVHNDGRDRLEDFDGEQVAFLDDALAAVIGLIRADERGRCVEELAGHSKELMHKAVADVSAGKDSGFASVSYASTLDRASKLLASGELSTPPVEVLPPVAEEASNAHA